MEEGVKLQGYMGEDLIDQELTYTKALLAHFSFSQNLPRQNFVVGCLSIFMHLP